MHIGRPNNPRHPLLFALVALGCAVALSACGSSGSSSKASGSSSPGSSSRFNGVEFAQCMRAHGISNFPDPSSRGGGVQIGGPGLNPQSPGFQSAQKACSKLLPGGGPLSGGHGSEARKLELVNLARCMRSHGVPSFPDPTTTPPPAPHSGGGGVAFGTPGGFLSIPESLIQSPAFNQAARTCKFPGFGGSGGAKPGPGI